MAQTFAESWDVTWYTAAERVRSMSITASAATLDATFNPGRSFRLKEVRVTVDIAGTTEENFTMTLDSDIGSTHDLPILTKDLKGLVGYNYLFDPQRVYGPDDSIVFAWPNTETRDVGVEVIYCTGS